MGLKLFGREIIFEQFQPMWSWYLNVTDGQTTCNLITTLCVALCGKKPKSPLFQIRSFLKWIRIEWRSQISVWRHTFQMVTSLYTALMFCHLVSENKMFATMQLCVSSWSVVHSYLFLRFIAWAFWLTWQHHCPWSPCQSVSLHELFSQLYRLLFNVFSYSLQYKVK